jgi:hypothetical protein
MAEAAEASAARVSRMRAGAVAVLVGAAACGCGATASHRAATPTTLPSAPGSTESAPPSSSTTTPGQSTTGAPLTTSAAPTTSAPATSSPPARTRATAVQLGDNAKGTTTTVAVGSTITVVLNSTYWTINSPTGPVLVASGPPVPHPGQGCGPTIPGSGCGTVTLVVRAAAVGASELTAQRVSCGEALRCSPDQSVWSVAVRVTA